VGAVTRYILRRLLYMIPTLFGVLVLTFLLFNVVGGSPAGMALGKNASPQALEEFDEARGYNKPLLAGRWTTTRACSDGRGQDRTFGPGEAFALPLAFPLRPATRYRLSLAVAARQPVAGEWTWGPTGALGHCAAQVAPDNGRQVLEFQTGQDPAREQAPSLCAGGPITVRGYTLRRRVRHPLDSQFVHFLGQVVRFDLGTSAATNQRVSTMLKRGIGPSLLLTIPIFFGGLMVSIVLALLCAWQRDRWLDRTLVVTAVVLMSVNYLVWIILGQFILAYKLNWFPIWGFESWRYLLLPVLIGILSGLGGNLRFYRTVMLDEMYRDYVRTAYAKGLGPAAVLFRHVLPNAMIPIVTNTVIALPFLYTGSLLLESFFGIPGLGGMSINAINSADVDVVRGIVLIGAVLYMGANLLTDLCYAAVDPRVTLR
jgi:peptide/nickel transport system permease protein